MSRLTLGHFSRTGCQDCCNVIDASEMYDAWIRIGRPTDPEAAINVVREAFDDDDSRAEWFRQLDADACEDLDPDACFRAWLDGWKACAIRYVGRWMAGWDRDYRESME